MLTYLKSIPKRKILAAALIVVGVLLVGYFGVRSIRSFQKMRYIREQGMDLGAVNVEDIRPWMTVQFVAVAYGVPQEYLFAEIDIPFEHRNSNDTLFNLNKKYDFGRPLNPEDLPILGKVRDAILQYQANPVSTGLTDDVRAWMSIRYIANSTGVSEKYIFAQIGIPAESNEGKPLERLYHEFHYKGGRRALVDAVRQALDTDDTGGDNQ